MNPIKSNDFYQTFWIKNGFQQRGLINHVLAKRFINPGDHLCLNCIFLGRRRLINNGVLINPDLTLFMVIYGYLWLFIYRHLYYIDP